MTVLAVETCTSAASVAVVDEEGVLAERVAKLGREHCRQVPGMILGVMQDARRTLDGMDAFAVGIGPGSFTGLRVGVAMVKALAFAKDKPAVGISSLEGLAANVSHLRRPVWTLVDTGRTRGDVYWACFRCEAEEPELVEGPGCLPAEEVAGKLSTPALVVGDSVCRRESVWRGHVGRGVELGGWRLAFPRASVMGALALRRLAAGHGVRAEEILPVYVTSPNVGKRRKVC